MHTLENERSFRPLPAPNRPPVSLPVVRSADVSFDDDEISPSLPGWKRTLDLIAIIATSPVWLTVMMSISLWIKLVSPGPVFFTQDRIGFRGKRFKILKFRSMKVHAETETHEEHFDRLVESGCPMTKLDARGDGRMIFSGWLLRATGLDELPQLFNVLQGDMSLVGPRPCTEHELSKFQMEHLERFDACPGLTGHWQVNGKNNTTFSRMIELDVFYARNASLRLDLLILLKTVPALVSQVRETRSGRETRDNS